MAEVFPTVINTPLGQSVVIFVLIFTIVFGVLQKSKIFGDGKKQIDSLIALSIALLVLSAGYALDIIQQLAPFLAVSLVIILVFLLLVAVMYEKDAFKIDNGWKNFFFVATLFAVILAVLVFSGNWDRVYSFFSDSTAGGSVLLIVLVGVAIWFAWSGQDLGSSSGGKDKEKKE